MDNASNRTWLNTSTTRPYSDTIVYRNLPELVKKSILQTPEVYAQRQIFKHFYALFVPREKEPQFLEDHLTLCKRILDIIHRIGVETKISSETCMERYSFPACC